MNSTTAAELTLAIQRALVQTRSEDTRQSIATWLADQRSARAGNAPYVPSSLIIEDVSIVFRDSTLLIFFGWPLMPGRSFVYIETLEDLNPLSPEVWADIVLAHFDETIGAGFYDRLPTVRVGRLEFVGPDVV